MSKTGYLILMVIIIFSYKQLENIFKKFFNKSINYQLWESKGYYAWGLILLIIYLVVNPIDYIVKVPVNNKWGIMAILYVGISTIFTCIYNINIYYPRKSNKFRCFHYGVMQPIFEEVAFRGLILPMTVYILGDHAEAIILLNGIIFMAFHLNYWSFNKENVSMFFSFLIIGVYFSYIALITQSIIYPILCHIIINGGNTLYRNLKYECR